MGKCLVIGSSVCDVMVYTDRLPSREEDAHVQKQMMSVDGCAFNVVTILHQLGCEYDFISPIGSGLYGEFVSKELQRLGIYSPIRLSGENGCCYCFVEEDGERTFLSHHGVEYSFDSSWLEGLELESYDYIYICGLEVEESSGSLLIHSLKKRKSQVIFAPGPRGHLINKERLTSLLDLEPILHVNEREALALSGKKELKAAVQLLYHQTRKPVIVTLGSRGVLAFDGDWHSAPAYPCSIYDTIGAGDSHVGALIAALTKGKKLDQALDFANLVSSYVVSCAGVHLSSEEYEELSTILNHGNF